MARVVLSARVTPETKEIVDVKAADLDVSVGEYLDRTVEHCEGCSSFGGGATDERYTGLQAVIKKVEAERDELQAQVLELGQLLENETHDEVITPVKGRSLPYSEIPSISLPKGKPVRRGEPPAVKVNGFGDPIYDNAETAVTVPDDLLDQIVEQSVTPKVTKQAVTQRQASPAADAAIAKARARRDAEPVTNLAKPGTNKPKGRFGRG